MNEFIIYVLKSVLALGLFALVYRLVFINEGNFINRRIYLLFSVNLAMILPFFTFYFPAINNGIPGVVLDEITVYSNGIRLIRETSVFPVVKVLKLLYLIITGLLVFRLLFHMTGILIKTKKVIADENEGIKLYLLKDKNISYSFFRNVFIGQTSDQQEQERILEHEKIHAKQLHSVDVIYTEFLAAIFWFNPLIWWFRNELKNVHEYLADQGALEKGFDRKLYQITLLEHLIGSASISITNNFNYSLIKNRIAMMNKEKKGKKNTWKVFLILPVSIMIAFAFACTEKSPSVTTDVTPQLSAINAAYYEADQMPVFPGGNDALINYIATNVNYPKEAISKQVQGKVFVQFVVDKTGKIVTSPDDFKVYDKDKKEKTILGAVTVIGYKPAEGSPVENVEQYVELLQKEAVRVVSSLPAFEKPGMHNGAPVAVVFTIPINFALQ